MELCVSVLQVVNCWCTQLYVTSDVAVLCSFTRGGDLCRAVFPEMLLYEEEGLSFLLGGIREGCHGYSSLPHGK